MAIVTGRLASFRIGEIGASTSIDFIGKWIINISADTVESKPFDSLWTISRPVAERWNGIVEGFFDASTTGGSQATLWQNIFSGIKVQDARFYVGGSTTGLFYMPQWTPSLLDSTCSTDAGCYLINWNQSIAARELGLIKFDVIGYKAIGLFASTIAGLGEGGLGEGPLGG